MTKASCSRTPEIVDREIAATETQLTNARRALSAPGIATLNFSPSSLLAQQPGYTAAPRMRAIRFGLDVARAELALAELRRERAEINLAALNAVDDAELQAQMRAANEASDRLKHEASAARGVAWRLKQDWDFRIERRSENSRHVLDFGAAATAARKEVELLETELAQLERWRPAPAA